MKFCIFNYLINYRTIPLLTSFIESLINQECNIDLFTVGDSKKTNYNDNFNVYSFRKFIYNNFSPFLLLIKSFNLIKKKKHDYIVAVDPVSLIPAFTLSKIFKIKLIYISLEVYVKDDVDNIFYQYYYILQRYLIKYCNFIISIDESRKRLLLNNIFLKEENIKTLLLPNSFLGEAKYNFSNFLYERLRIDKRKKILLSPGSIEGLINSKELSSYSKKINDDFIIVLHSRKKIDKRKLSGEFKENNQFKLSLKPVDYKDIDILFSSAYIGLVLYKIANKGIRSTNLETIGKSSGKLNQFLKNGIPVIMSELSYFKYIGKKYQCGVCVNSFNEINAAIKKIKANYNYYSRNAIKCFNDELQFEPAFNKSYKYLKKYPLKNK